MNLVNIMDRVTNKNSKSLMKKNISRRFKKETNIVLCHIMRRDTLGNIVITGKVRGRKGRRRQRKTILDGLKLCHREISLL